ncbi:hypothetical protein CTheo_8443 [Ceratobasidium theobromae]|uniref:Coiled-coil domain-containing protein 16 n=1 Tax=Ceratobasidium theobromae TaxID=1582974 RepID=A0A5N5Q8R6_9AGAM|nr:hypothetical protein CTheo_8443 [Ceratobasidium theobromae]
MSDARSLLRRAKAAESEKRINHPLALYNAAGQLRCGACGTAVKPHAWEGHVISKAHRTQVARLRAEEEKEQAKKRKAAENIEVDEDEDDAEGKRRRTAEPESAPLVQSQPAGGLPVDFFSDPSQAPVSLGIDDDDEDQDQVMASEPANNPSSIDEEFAAFAKAVLQPTLKPNTTDVYEAATVSAEPELVSNVPDGFPASVLGAENADGEPNEQVEETEEEKRRRLQEEERELIMDRLRDEEMAQEEADERVVRLKARLEAVRTGKAQGVGPAPTSTPGVDKKTLLKMLRGKKKAAPS